MCSQVISHHNNLGNCLLGVTTESRANNPAETMFLMSGSLVSVNCAVFT